MEYYDSSLNSATPKNQQFESFQLILIIGCLLVVATSAVAIQRFDLVVLRFLEGYWPPWMHFLRYWCIQRQRQQLNQAEKCWQVLAAKKAQQNLTANELNEFVALDKQLMQAPSQLNRLMPTRLGNILRAAENRSLDKYGLDAVICWPRLWLILPDGVKKEVQEARTELNTAARAWLWSLLFLIWVMWAWWAIPISLLSSLFAYHWMLAAAITYGEMVESTFDLHRIALYQSLRWPLPESPAEEHQLGFLLTEYLWRGSDKEQPKFTKS
ncbi:MAG: hypothetical protein F6K19_51430 [Cyanothece sp. SIO1E1]|nr:hypothetical protein [Cyanothece sp. SIO1E1]